METVSRFTLLLVVLTGLATGPALAGGVHPQSGEPLADAQTFTYRITSEPGSFDPQLVGDLAGQEIARDLFEGLFNQDEIGNLVPGVATDYDLSRDRRTYTFHLRDTARWSNGDPLTASDFVYAWRRAADPATGSPYRWFIEIMALENAGAVTAGFRPTEALGVEALDDHTLEVRLSRPTPYLPQMTTHTVTFPVPQKIIGQFGADWTKPEHIVSNGAYVLSEHEAGKHSVRLRNPLYWDNAHTIIDRVEARVIGDINAAITLFFAGDLDRTEVPPGLFRKLQDAYPDETVSFPRLCTYYLSFNMSDKAPEALRDKRVRQALSLAIDRSVITEEILGAGQSEAYTFTPSTVAGFDPPATGIVWMTQAERNRKARTLIAEAGYGQDHPLSFRFLYNTSDAHKKIAEAIARMWKEKLGVSVELADLEWTTFLKTRDRQEFDVARGGWCGDYNEASTFLDLVSSSSGYNYGHYTNPRVDELLAQSKTGDAAEAYTEIERIIADDVPIIPLYHYSAAYMLNSTIGNWPADNAEQAWYSKNLYRIAYKTAQ